MSEVREIVTRAVLAKGRKTFRICETITPDNPPYSVLGCWVINHEFEATQNEKQVELFGNFEIILKQKLPVLKLPIKASSR